MQLEFQFETKNEIVLVSANKTNNYLSKKNSTFKISWRQKKPKTSKKIKFHCQDLFFEALPPTFSAGWTNHFNPSAPYSRNRNNYINLPKKDGIWLLVLKTVQYLRKYFFKSSCWTLIDNLKSCKSVPSSLKGGLRKIFVLLCYVFP